ncbi:MAG: YncE family protein [Sandaracinaceae bacterium]
MTAGGARAAWISLLIAGCGGASTATPRSEADTEVADPRAGETTRLSLGDYEAIAIATRGPGARAPHLFVAAAERDGDGSALYALGEAGWSTFDLEVHAAALATDGTALVLAGPAGLGRFDPDARTYEAIGAIDVGSVGGVAAGYGGVTFVSDPSASRVWAFYGETRIELASGLEEPRALLLDGGRLWIASSGGIANVDLASRRLTDVDEDGVGTVDGATGIALDHRGRLVAAIDDGALVLFDPTRSPRLLTRFETAPRTIAIDADRGILYTASSVHGDVEAIDYLALVGEDRAAWERDGARTMRPFRAGGFELSGAEYWPYRGDAEPDYPAEILWGFYPRAGEVFEGAITPASATDDAIRCAERSYAALRELLASPPPELALAHEAGASDRFYLWVNDYSTASEPFPHEVREARLWYWERQPTVLGRIPGFWKWETTLHRDGRCAIPERAQVEAYLRDRLAAR